jgi:carbonic anhydrase
LQGLKFVERLLRVALRDNRSRSAKQSSQYQVKRFHIHPPEEFSDSRQDGRKQSVMARHI